MSAIWVVLMVISVILLILLLMRIYCRLTVGICECQQDMTGKTVLITGASSGIGKSTAMDLAHRNARVLLACRNLEKAEKVKSEIVTATGNSNVVVYHLELESFDSVRKCAQDVLKTEERLDVLINNAGTANEPSVQLTEDGCERHMQVNHLGHFLLTILLLDLLKQSKTSRIINVSSLTYLLAKLDMDDMNADRQNFFWKHIGNLYNRTKLANIWFTAELAKRLADTGVTVNALHPGLIHTGILYHVDHPTLYIYRFLVNILGKSSEEGAQTSIYLAVHPDVQGVTGKFFYGCREGMLITRDARNKTKAAKFFKLSEELVGEKFRNYYLMPETLIGPGDHLA